MMRAFSIDSQILAILTLVLLLVCLACLVMILLQRKALKRLEKKLEHFMLGRNAASLENTLSTLVGDVVDLKDKTEANKKDIITICRKFEKAYQKMGLVKYDAFSQMGGQLSFSLALLDEFDSGFIINSVHSTEGSYCYTKEVRRGTCAINLGKEEAEALAIAMESNTR